MNKKIAITCDHLLNRSHYTEIIEYLCELYPEAVIYCFAHKKGAILGRIEARKIKSTYLSNIVETEKDFYQHAHKLPILARNLFISCEYEIVINISKGFSQGMKKCEKAKQFTYLYDLDFSAKIKNNLLQKILFPFVSSWIYKTLDRVDQLTFSRLDLQKRLLAEEQIVANDESKKMKVIPPPFRIADYSLFPKSMYPHHFFLIEAKGLTLKNAEELISWMKEWRFDFQFLGVDDHLSELKKKHPENMFFGNRCSGEHAPVLAACLALVSFNTEDFPHYPLAALSTGRPVAIDSSLEKWLSGEGISMIKKWNQEQLDKEELKNILFSLKENHDQYIGERLRAFGVQFHDIKFKSEIKRQISLFV